MESTNKNIKENTNKKECSKNTKLAAVELILRGPKCHRHRLEPCLKRPTNKAGPEIHNEAGLFF